MNSFDSTSLSSSRSTLTANDHRETIAGYNEEEHLLVVNDDQQKLAKEIFKLLTPNEMTGRYGVIGIRCVTPYADADALFADKAALMVYCTDQNTANAVTTDLLNHNIIRTVKLIPGHASFLVFQQRLVYFAFKNDYG